jgi:hemerythrin superfamily protein
MHVGRTSGAVLFGAACGFLAGLAADPARKLAIQGIEAAMGDWVDILTAEHRSVEKAFEALLATEPDEAAKHLALLLRIAHALNKHAQQEENVVYPAIRKRNPGGAGELVADHAEIKSLLSELQYDIDKSDPQWLATAATLRDKVVSHARLEEQTIFPAARAAMSEGENAALTRHMNWEGLKAS